ncbi:MAG: undecaprenyl-diphosphate phosphatase [Armatimonadetes bacterium]|nr:MAG: undecaprenyl-diphosphate phosphatase [Armatimonadota bacterium]
MLNAVFWGLIQGLTEFLPVSSSGHLVLIPAILDREGPDLATTAMLHLGTLAAVLVYYRNDIAKMAKFDRPARKLITLIAIGSVPAVIGALVFEDKVEELIHEPATVAIMLVVTGIILLATGLLRIGDRTTESLRPLDSLVIGLAQSLALIPGISRSGMTISAGLVRGMNKVEAARFAFLLGIPVIAGAGLFEMIDFVGSGESIDPTVWIGVVVAGVSGYLAIAVLIRLLARVGLAPFGIYCVTAGTIATFLV